MGLFVPANDLEAALQAAKSGQIPILVFLRKLVEAELAVPSASEVQADGTGFEPLLFPKGEQQMLGCFTDRSRIVQFAELTPYCMMMRGREVLRRVPAGFGIVINPGWSVGFDVSPEGIAKILRDTA